MASAIRIGAPVRRAEAERARTESHGAFRSVTDAEILAAYARIASTEGIFCEPSSATSVAVLAGAVEQGLVERGARVVCVLTGNGLKDPDSAVALAGEATVIPASLDALSEIVTATAVPA